MAMKRVTMQDIADACGLSRNTVSKIFNGRGTVPESTRNLVLQKAQEIGYYQMPEQIPRVQSLPPQNIALMTCHMPSEYHFGMIFLPVFTERLSRAGYTLMFHEVSPEDLRARRLPPHMSPEQTAGILGTELFDRDYLEMLCGLGLPVLSVDAHMDAMVTPMKCDFILMENLSSTIAVTSQMISAGARRLGFVGDKAHCCSFHERWMGFCYALERAGLSLEQKCCILADDALPYGDTDWLVARFREMPSMPDALFCANDYLAFYVTLALKQLGLKIPTDVMVAGFDNTPQSAAVEPPLTTVEIPHSDFGRIAADILLDRIENPDRPFRATYIKTTPVWRRSTAR